MRSGSRKNLPLRAFTLLLLLGAVVFAAGCSTAQSPGGSGTNVNHILPSGNSVAGWLVVPSGGLHARTATLDYIAGGSSGCTQCHGSDLTGGISGVSCFDNPAGCHHNPVANWATPAVHGTTAKQAPGSSGFAACQICHGRNFSGGGGGIADACADCHGIPAPHPAAPWRGSAITHTDTNDSNAPVCAQCHFPGSPNNPPNHPATPAPAGTAPGCFNSTLCHGESTVPHPVGSTWVATSPAPQPHAFDAKATPGATTGFTYCQACHGTGTDFAGGVSGVSCTNTAGCHGATVASPHASQWRTGDTYVHTTTAEGNASVCGFCHLNGANSPVAPPSPPAPSGTAPGCFNNTLCHGAGGAPHPLGSAWVAASPAAQPHGDSAKTTPGSTTGFAYCQVCHGTGTTPPANFGGGSSGVSCLTCHGNPHSPAPWRASAGSTYNHTSTDPGNAPICAQCHFPGSLANPPNHPPSPAPAGTPPGCFNSTLCHNGGEGGGGASHPVPFNDNAHFTVTAATFPANCGTCHAATGTSPLPAAPLCTTCHAAGSPLAALNCTSCHASPPDGGTGTAYANIAGAHATHITLNGTGTPVTCNTCHNGLGTNTLNHYNRAKARVAPGDVAFPATYNAQTGASSFDNSAALSCSNVSCHGGQATPNWQTGVLDVNAQCTSCHSQGTAQFNSFNSGEHGINSDHSNCTNCHNTTTLAVNHFTALATSAMEGPASATIGGAGTAVTTYTAGSCTPQAGVGCHGTRNWQ